MVCDAMLPVLAVAVDGKEKVNVAECFLHWAAQVNNVLLVSCDWKNKRTQLSVMKWWNQARTQLLISQWNIDPMSRAACFWLINVLVWLEPAGTGGCCNGPHVHCYCWWEMAGGIQSPDSQLCEQLRWVQGDVETPSAAPSAFPQDALEREKRELCLFTFKFNLWSIWVKNAIYNWGNIWLFIEGREDLLISWLFMQYCRVYLWGFFSIGIPTWYFCLLYAQQYFDVNLKFRVILCWKAKQ